MIDDVMLEAEDKMERALEAAKHELAAIRTGRTALEVLGMDTEKAKEISEFYYHRDRHATQQMAEAYDPNLPRFGNERMAAIAKVNRAITREMIAKLLRGEPVDWQPREDSVTRHKG